MSDTRFITNENGQTLESRFKEFLKDVEFLDIIVGYFRTSGFHRMCQEFESIDKIRILVGLSVDHTAFDLIEVAKDESCQLKIDTLSHIKTKDIFSKLVIQELENYETIDSYNTEIGIKKFIEFLKTKKLEIKAHPSKNIHAKVYISRFRKDDRDFGRVITGSSNFSESGFVAQREFNVELKDRSDVEFALNQFEKLWMEGVDVSDKYVETVNTKTWVNDQISPYHLYLKFLYEYFKEDLYMEQEIESYLPEGFMELKYQKQAVVNAKKILDAYNGVFLADVVGLGKTFIAALLAQQLNGKLLVICPPVLVDYWKETFFHFGVRGYKVESMGKLDSIYSEIERYPEKNKFDYVLVDEAHRFRNEMTIGYDTLYKICFGKKVVLISATPLNNTIDDIYNQLKLFQSPKKSTIPGVPNLEVLFARLQKNIKKHEKGTGEYVNAVRSASKEVRDKILKYVMIRRTRTEIIKHYSEDIESKGLFFPDLANPARIPYEFDEQTDKAFAETIRMLKDFKYYRYTPILYLKNKPSEFEQQSQRNIGGFMKGIIIKRLESSFYAFRHTLDRFIESYEKFIKMFESGTIYVSKKANVYELLENDNEEKLLQLIDEDKAKKYKSDEFEKSYKEKLEKDLKLLKEIKSLWLNIKTDPKLNSFLEKLRSDKILNGNKIIIFTESKETGDYLYENINKFNKGHTFFFSSFGGKYGKEELSLKASKQIIKENYDPSYGKDINDVKYLITTDILAEGMNLHNSNVVLNYDLPWNPTRVLQRVGRINRVGTKHEQIYIYNFFPTSKADKHLGLEESIKSKIQAFHDALGEDAKYLTEDEELSTHSLFGKDLYDKLNNKKSYQPEEDEDSELVYLKEIQDLRKNNIQLFDKIKNLPKKARSCKEDTSLKEDKLITFFRKGKLKKFFISNKLMSEEVNFFEAAKILKTTEEELKNVPPRFFEMLSMNRERFEFSVSNDSDEAQFKQGGLSNEKTIIKLLKSNVISQYKGFTDEDDEFIKLVLNALENGIIPKKSIKKIKDSIEQKKLNMDEMPLKIIKLLRENIPENIVSQNEIANHSRDVKKEIILSEYLIKG